MKQLQSNKDKYFVHGVEVRFFSKAINNSINYNYVDICSGHIREKIEISMRLDDIYKLIELNEKLGNLNKFLVTEMADYRIEDIMLRNTKHSVVYEQYLELKRQHRRIDGINEEIDRIEKKHRNDITCHPFTEERKRIKAYAEENNISNDELRLLLTTIIMINNTPYKNELTVAINNFCCDVDEKDRQGEEFRIVEELREYLFDYKRGFIDPYYLMSADNMIRYRDSLIRASRSMEFMSLWCGLATYENNEEHHYDDNARNSVVIYLFRDRGIESFKKSAPTDGNGVTRIGTVTMPYNDIQEILEFADRAKRLKELSNKLYETDIWNEIQYKMITGKTGVIKRLHQKIRKFANENNVSQEDLEMLISPTVIFSETDHEYTDKEYKDYIKKLVKED